ncbi:anthranilate synthase subunit II [Candidatus Desulfofervidus auxilii]|uniref:Aminodeoxychorismate/anthranilate synthase component II n=1 Tax=Desulfofervidus auxilii TaxID=1621989 RepID=A0A7V1K4N4_DESA2|nr:aminodeoxychorismate/anthranilate synthase component II [Candidatus Desulfofervidus auxilii]AMM40888.1 anthranilate synthase subunit II [Candidatus Desulfofervidus auxilii]HEB74463.1 aminodeoxychorismate/anthranilate synthase component II [Candidatus Desulfofervidus auxilii]HEC49567.1 aminodeoxychorismate/anthranilate synthase component II [Candidatus Desulfofervidus auxilii]
MLVIIDNYDSFTYNLAQYFQILGVEVRVFRNDQLKVEEIQHFHPDYLVISPGPCTPKEAGISVKSIRFFKGKLPILGVCLGHQAIAAAFEGKIVQAKKIMHGKTSMIYHDNKTIFHNLPNPFEATRYHSLAVERESLPNCLEITAWSEDNEIMGIRHKEYIIEGVQFHPESILTKVGMSLLKNFLAQGKKR